MIMNHTHTFSRNEMFNRCLLIFLLHAVFPRLSVVVAMQGTEIPVVEWG